MICAFCGQPINTVRYKSHKRKAYHYDCYDRLLAGESSQKAAVSASAEPSSDMTALEEYIKKLFGLTELPYTLQEQIANYTSVQHIRPSTIQKVLHYFYDIEGNKPNRDRPSIGIVPYVFEEAKAYYKKLYDLEHQEQKKEVKETEVTIRISPPDNQLKMKTDISKL